MDLTAIFFFGYLGVGSACFGLWYSYANRKDRDELIVISSIMFLLAWPLLTLMGLGLCLGKLIGRRS